MTKKSRLAKGRWVEIGKPPLRKQSCQDWEREKGWGGETGSQSHMILFIILFIFLHFFWHSVYQMLTPNSLKKINTTWGNYVKMPQSPITVYHTPPTPEPYKWTSFSCNEQNGEWRPGQMKQGSASASSIRATCWERHAVNHPSGACGCVSTRKQTHLH